MVAEEGEGSRRCCCCCCSSLSARLCCWLLRGGGDACDEAECCCCCCCCWVELERRAICAWRASTWAERAAQASCEVRSLSSMEGPGGGDGGARGFPGGAGGAGGGGGVGGRLGITALISVPGGTGVRSSGALISQSVGLDIQAITWADETHGNAAMMARADRVLMLQQSTEAARGRTHAQSWRASSIDADDAIDPRNP